jgi:hypothetical protein
MVSSAAVAVILMITVVAALAADPPTPCRSSLIPAYVPAAGLAELASDAEPGRSVILNPASGPGTALQADYKQATAAAQKAGTKVLGYVPTGYGARDPAAVRADVERYRTWYGVDGIFLDETAHDDAQLPYYQALSRELRAGGVETIAINPGIVPAPGYFGLADVVVTFEGPYAEYAAAQQKTPGWVRDQPRERIAHLVYGATAKQAEAVVKADAYAGHVYVTDGALPHPWGSLPPYLRDEEKSLATCGG